VTRGRIADLGVVGDVDVADFVVRRVRGRRKPVAC
jgi:hypothetical protein